MSAYDRWLERPYTDQPEGEECPDCHGSGMVPDDMHDGSYDPRDNECRTCEGSGVIWPPTRAEIEDQRGEERFDQLHEEGRI